MDSFRAIIERWGTPAKFASDIKVSADLVRVWKSRNSIPSEYFADVAAAAKTRKFSEITTTHLLSLRRRRRAA
jgi:hypothetical protein